MCLKQGRTPDSPPVGKSEGNNNTDDAYEEEDYGDEDFEDEIQEAVPRKNTDLQDDEAFLDALDTEDIIENGQVMGKGEVEESKNNNVSNHIKAQQTQVDVSHSSKVVADDTSEGSSDDDFESGFLLSQHLGKLLAKIRMRPAPKPIEQLRELCLVDSTALGWAVRHGAVTILIEQCGWDDTRLKALGALAILVNASNDARREAFDVNSNFGPQTLMAFLTRYPNASDYWTICTQLLADAITHQKCRLSARDVRCLLNGISKHATSRPKVAVNASEVFYALFVHGSSGFRHAGSEDGNNQSFQDAAQRIIIEKNLFSVFARAFRSANAASQRWIRVGVLALCCLANYKMSSQHEKGLQIKGQHAHEEDDPRLKVLLSDYNTKFHNHAKKCGPNKHVVLAESRFNLSQDVEDNVEPGLLQEWGKLQCDKDLKKSSLVPGNNSPSTAIDKTKDDAGQGVKDERRVIVIRGTKSSNNRPASAKAAFEINKSVRAINAAMGPAPMLEGYDMLEVEIQQDDQDELVRANRPQSNAFGSKSAAGKACRPKSCSGARTKRPRSSGPGKAPKPGRRASFGFTGPVTPVRIVRHSGMSHWEPESSIHKWCGRRTKLPPKISKPRISSTEIMLRAMDTVAPGQYSQVEISATLKQLKKQRLPFSSGVEDGCNSGTRDEGSATGLGSGKDMEISMDDLIAAFDSHIESPKSPCQDNGINSWTAHDKNENSIAREPSGGATEHSPPQKPGKKQKATEQPIARSLESRAVVPKSPESKTYDAFKDGLTYAERLREMISATKSQLSAPSLSEQLAGQKGQQIGYSSDEDASDSSYSYESDHKSVVENVAEEENHSERPLGVLKDIKHDLKIAVEHSARTVQRIFRGHQVRSSLKLESH